MPVRSNLLRLVPSNQKTASNSTRPANSKLRPREYLTEAEIERLLTAAKKNQ
jgi:hypothetical protein